MDWCTAHLGAAPADVLFERRSLSDVTGLRLADGREVVVKAREDEGRAACVAAQARLAERGFPCPRPLTPVITAGTRAVHAEEFRPGGAPPPLPNPRWARWDHPDPGLWPSIGFLDSRDQSVVPAVMTETAVRARKRLLAADLPCVLGHAGFEAQNLRWRPPGLR